jgi:hypothetical protein
MAYLVVSIVIQALLIIHCIRTGRNQLWIWVLALLSIPGVIAYVAVEIVPELWRSRRARSAARGVQQVLDPERDLRAAAERAGREGNVASLHAYAEALERHGKAGEAIPVYREALTGLYQHDPDLMLGLARAQFESGAATDARQTLDDLIARNPDFRSPDGHLLYARSLEAEGDHARALEEYAAVVPGYPGAEAPVRYARLLRVQGREDEAQRVLRELVDHAKAAPAHYRRAQREWLAEAERGG